MCAVMIQLVDHEQNKLALPECVVSQWRINHTRKCRWQAIEKTLVGTG